MPFNRTFIGLLILVPVCAGAADTTNDHLYSRLMDAIDHDDLAAVKDVVLKEGTNPNYSPGSEQKPLARAAIQGSVEIVNFLTSDFLGAQKAQVNHEVWIFKAPSNRLDEGKSTSKQEAGNQVSIVKPGKEPQDRKLQVSVNNGDYWELPETKFEKADEIAGDILRGKSFEVCTGSYDNRLESKTVLDEVESALQSHREELEKYRNSKTKHFRGMVSTWYVTFKYGRVSEVDKNGNVGKGKLVRELTSAEKNSLKAQHAANPGTLYLYTDEDEYLQYLNDSIPQLEKTIEILKSRGARKGMTREAHCANQRPHTTLRLLKTGEVVEDQGLTHR